MDKYLLTSNNRTLAKGDLVKVLNEINKISGEVGSNPLNIKWNERHDLIQLEYEGYYCNFYIYIKEGE